MSETQTKPVSTNDPKMNPLPEETSKIIHGKLTGELPLSPVNNSNMQEKK